MPRFDAAEHTSIRSLITGAIEIQLRGRRSQKVIGPLGGKEDKPTAGSLGRENPTTSCLADLNVWLAVAPAAGDIVDYGNDVLTIGQGWAVFDRWLEESRIGIRQESSEIESGFRSATQPLVRAPFPEGAGGLLSARGQPDHFHDAGDS